MSDSKKIVVILMDEDPFSKRYRVCGRFDTRAEAEKEAEYQIGRRYEKEGWNVERVVFGEDIPAEVVQSWADKYHQRLAKHAREDAERAERAEFDRLNKKYGAKP